MSGRRSMRCSGEAPHDVQTPERLGREQTAAKGRRAPALDGFRWIAALLVVAIHTSPLACVDGTADFLLTRVLARVAVPFFLMTTGYFMAAHREDGRWLLGQMDKLAAIYTGAVVAYLPLNAYMGDLARLTPGTLARALIFDGTFYHLWYLPAVLLGLPLTWVLLRKTGMRGATIAAAALYAVGLLGDSYFGLIAGTPLEAVYGGMFQCFRYTRNGLFFAPMFLALGAALRGSGLSAALNRMRTSGLAAGLAASLALMAAEALALRGAGWMRHDSMYVMLLPTMAFLFALLLRVNGPGRRRWRSLTLWIYLVHPWAIVLVRGAAKLVRLQAWLIENSVGHFLSVAALSVALALAIEWARERYGRRSGGRLARRLGRRG